MGLMKRYVAIALAALLAGPVAADEITVFAAASLKNAMDEVADGFEAAAGHEVTVSYAGSSALARQIELGAPADVFISANPGWMDRLEEAGTVEDGTRIDLLGNRIVLIAHGAADPVEIGPRMDLGAMLGEGRLAMALVDAVPAGIYGKAALESLGQWQAVEPRVVQADNVRAALKLVAIGEAPMGVVYATDAAAEEGVSVLGVFPEDSHPPIVYPAAAMSGRVGPMVAEFLGYLQSGAAREVFERHGFTVLAD
ncbi:molybdate ABC transporter substrate-binding protein [Roseovarius sp.]|uniref:molybdate ABC transporter substrate-binding protein n=1 Tax=Roseovarius sp. TaxID=1486281 RepID=UPI00262383E9|nr:molybdate ABC transporter substrate-binding protein [Roseovarius sp.]MDM8168734.1 molybdate ABC transporter substrate-binding protein [Roseovarius sp.]